MANSSRVLVTGGAGFIGRRVVRALLAAGHEVTVVDLCPFPDQEVRSVVGDLCEHQTVTQAVQPGTDVIIHLAAITSVLKSVEDPVSTYRLNVDATARLLERARENETGTFLLASTNAVAGGPGQFSAVAGGPGQFSAVAGGPGQFSAVAGGPGQFSAVAGGPGQFSASSGGNAGSAAMTENVSLRPLTPYGATKAAAEMLLGAYTNCYGIKGAALRFSNVYGPGMEAKDSFIPRLMRAARDGEGVQVRGDGSMLRDVVHVDDVVQGIFTAWDAGYTGPLILGSGQSVTVNEMVQTARRVTGKPIPVEHVSVSSGEMQAVVLDISALRSLGYQPQFDLEKGMATVWPDFDPQAHADEQGA